MTTNRPRIFSCPGCSLRVTGLERECPRCKRRFGEEAELECPFCGTLVSPRLDACPSCGIDYNEFVDHAEEQLWQKALDKIVEEIEELKTEDQARPAVATPRQPSPAVAPAAEPGDDEAVCPVCHRVVSLSDPVCPGCGSEFEDEEELYDESNAVCPMCGATVSYEAAMCPSCGAEFEDEGEEGEVEQVPEVVGEPPPAGAVTGQVSDERGGLLAKTPAAKAHAGTGLSNGFSVTNGSGIINGKGQTNGVQFVNGLGAVNGKDLINGSGAYNGTGSGRSVGGRRGHMRPIYLRWQLIAVLVAAAIIVPSYLQFSRSGDEGPFSVDGDFGDWEDAAMFTVMSVSTDVDPDVVEWSVATYGDYVYLYVHMSREVMAGMAAQRVTLFIDSDDSADSGYLVDGIGADHMMELFGWNGSVSTSLLFNYHSTEDRLDWNEWRPSGPVENRLAGERLEAKARIVGGLNQSAKFLFAAQDEASADCISYAVGLTGGVLIIEQGPSPEISDTEVLPIGHSVSMLRLTFTCQGSGGTVDGVTPALSGVTLREQFQPFSLEVGDEHVMDVMVDSSALSVGDMVSAYVPDDEVSCSFSSVQVTGGPVRAYAGSAPVNITIDGAFADWAGRTVADVDFTPIANPNIDIDEVGANSTDEDCYFFVSVLGTLCAGSYVPKTCAVPVSSGGGTVVPSRRTAEDFLRIFIDSDRSVSSGKTITIGALTIGADQMIEVRGLCREIVSIDAYLYAEGAWTLLAVPVDAAKDVSRLEIGIASHAIGDPEGVDFLMESTDWSGDRDYATNQSIALSMRTWAVDSSGTSQYATSMSYQRKILYDGTSYWSFYFDGSNTVCEYSDDGGETWTSRGSVFKASDVREVSIWYDPDNDVVYAVGDRGTASTSIYVQKGTLNSGSKTISWAASDSTKAVSTQSVAGKNSYICRDTNGYLWMLVSDLVQTNPQVKYQIGAWKSDSTNDITSWTSTGTLLPSGGTQDSDICGSVVPAGTGSDVWAVYAYEGKVFSKKYSGSSWESNSQTVYSGSGTQSDNTINAPPSVVVDDDKVVHVIYGDNSEDAGVSKPKVFYTRNNTGATTWATATDLDSNKPSNVGDVYPTITVDTSTGDLYAFWMRTDTSAVPKTVMGKTYSGGSWASLSFGTQTSYTKHHLSSIYNISGGDLVCWQWTQNTSGTIEVMFDKIPEFQDMALPVLFMIAMFAIISKRNRSRKGSDEKKDA